MYILSSLEITDYEVRLIVGEYSDSRFNLLHIERAGCSGVKNRRIYDVYAVQKAIKTVKEEAKKKLGYEIRRVLVLLPGIDFHRSNQRVSIYIGNQAISKHHVHDGLKTLVEKKEIQNLQFVSLSNVRFTVNGILSRKSPIGEICEELQMEADLLYASQEMVFEYVGVCEKSGFEVLDIVLDAVAFGEEAAILEQSMDRYVIGVDVQRQGTGLMLYYKGALLHYEYLSQGMSQLALQIYHLYGFAMKDCYRLLENMYTFDEKKMHDSIVHLWQEGKETKYLSEKELGKILSPLATQWMEKIKEMSDPIVSEGLTKFVFSGSGSQMVALQSLFPMLGSEATVYIPQTIGARSPTYIHGLGAFYAYQSPWNMRRGTSTSVDDEVVQQQLRAKGLTTNSDGSITKRLKKIFNS